MSTEERRRDDESSSEEVLPPHAKDLYDKKTTSKAVRVLTVLAYLLSVSFAAILLSVYYIFIWDPPRPTRGGEPSAAPLRDYSPGVWTSVDLNITVPTSDPTVALSTSAVTTPHPTLASPEHSHPAAPVAAAAQHRSATAQDSQQVDTNTVSETRTTNKQQHVSSETD